MSTGLWTNIDQASWLVRRQAKRRIKARIWTPATVAMLESYVGRLTVHEMARKLGLKYHQIAQKLVARGWRVRRDVHDPLGLNCKRAAMVIGVPYEWLWREIKAGRVKTPRTGHWYFIRWPEIRRLTRKIERYKAMRQRVLEGIREPVITKTQFDRLLNMSETQTHRYVQSKLVRAWKVPTLLPSIIKRKRWEWLISKADAERIARERAAGTLKFNRRLREMIRANNRRVTELRKDRRLGTREDLKHRMSCVIPGCYSVTAVAAQAGLTEVSVYSHIRNGRLPAENRQVGSRTYLAVKPEVLPAYLKWARQPTRAKSGRPKAPSADARKILAMGYLTVAEACRRYTDLSPEALRDAIRKGRVVARHIGRMLAMRQKEVRRYVKIRRRWKEMKAHAQRTGRKSR